MYLFQSVERIIYLVACPCKTDHRSRVNLCRCQPKEWKLPMAAPPRPAMSQHLRLPELRQFLLNYCVSSLRCVRSVHLWFREQACTPPIIISKLTDDSAMLSWSVERHLLAKRSRDAENTCIRPLLSRPSTAAYRASLCALVQSMSQRIQ